MTNREWPGEADDPPAVPAYKYRARRRAAAFSEWWGVLGWAVIGLVMVAVDPAPKPVNALPFALAYTSVFGARRVERVNQRIDHALYRAQVRVAHTVKPELPA